MTLACIAEGGLQKANSLLKAEGGRLRYAFSLIQNFAFQPFLNECNFCNPPCALQGVEKVARDDGGVGALGVHRGVHAPHLSGGHASGQTFERSTHLGIA